MKNLQILSVVDDLQVTGVEEISGASPRAVKVTGTRGFRSAQRVEINGFGVNSFTVLSDKALRVIPGPTLDGVDVSSMDVFVLSGAFTTPRQARLVLALTQRPQYVEGIQALVQLCIKVLLTDSGSNRFDPAEGGGLLQNLGSSISQDSNAQLAAGISTSIQRTQEYIQAVQAGQRLALDEQLLSMELTDLSFRPTAGEVEATIRIVSGTGSAVNLPLTL